MKKQLNTATITNELSAGSVYFREARAKKEQKNAAIEASDERANGRTPEQAMRRTGEQVNARTPEQANARTGERVIKRHSYNFYEDQVQQIDWLDLKKKMNGDKVFNKSELVRHAVDAWLRKLKAKGEFDDYPNG